MHDNKSADFFEEGRGGSVPRTSNNETRKTSVVAPEDLNRSIRSDKNLLLEHGTDEENKSVATHHSRASFKTQSSGSQ